MSRVAAAGPRAWGCVLGALALLVRLPLLFGRHEVVQGTDSAYYLVLAHHILNGPSFPGEHFYTPGYPGFMALLEALPGRREDAIVIAQHMLGVAVVVAVVLFAWRYFGRAPALIAGTLAAISPVMIVVEHAYFPDFLFGVVVLAGALLLAEAVRREPPSLLLLAAAGVTFGIATYVKGSGQVLLVAPPLALLFATRDWRATLKGSAVAAAALILTIAPWIYRNNHQFGYPSMSNQAGMTLFNRVYDVDHRLVPTDQPYGRFARDVQIRERAADPDTRTVFSVYNALINERHLESDDAIEVQLRLARAGIADEPLTYAGGTFRQVRRLMQDTNRFEGRDGVEDELDRLNPPVPKTVTTAAWDLARPLSTLWWILSLAGFAGLLTLMAGSRQSRNAAAALLAVWLAVAFGTALAHGGLWRYSIQLAPITWMLGSAGLAILVSEVWSHARGLRTPRGVAGKPGDDPVFIVGCARSGTSLVRRMLGRHPRLAIASESEWRRAVDESKPTADRELVEAFLTAYAERSGKPRSGAKNPDDVMRIPLLHDLLPDAKFLHVIRDGREVAASIGEQAWWDGSVVDAATYWRTSVEEGRSDGRAVGPERYLELRLEDLVADPEGSLRGVCDWLGEAYSPEMLDYELSPEELASWGEEDQRTHRHLTKPPTPGLRDWRVGLSREDQDAVEAICGPLLEELATGSLEPRDSLAGTSTPPA